MLISPDLSDALQSVDDAHHAVKYALAHTDDPHLAVEAWERIRQQEVDAQQITNIAGAVVDRMATEAGRNRRCI